MDAWSSRFCTFAPLHSLAAPARHHHHHLLLSRIAAAPSPSFPSSLSPASAARSVLPARAISTSCSTDRDQPSPPLLLNPAISISRLPTATDLATLKLPTLHCSFPASVNPHYLAGKPACDTWIEALAQPPSASASSFLRDCLLPLLICRFIPKSISRHRLVHVIKTIAWLMIANDDDDHPHTLGSDSATTSQRADRVMAVLRGEDDDQSFFDCTFLSSIRPSLANKSARMLKALAELWCEMRQEMPPSLIARFISSMADYFEGLKVQAFYRANATIPNVDSYMEIRRQASFTIPCFVLMEYALGIELDNITYYHPLIQELHNVALDYLSLCNDVISCPIEIQNGDHFNLPFILFSTKAFEQHSTTLQPAMDQVFQMIQDLESRAITVIYTINKEHNKFDPDMVPSILAYAKGLSQCMSGAVAWFLETPRYQHADRRHELHQIPQKEISILANQQN